MQLLKSLSGLLLAFVSTTVLSAPLNTTGYFSVAESRTFEQQFAPHKWSSVGDAKVKTDGSTASAYLSASSTFGDREGLAQADLAAATLKAYSYAGSNTEMTAGSVGISSRAAFADSFSITSPSGSPFVWSSGEMVTFNLTVSGLSDYSPQLSDWVGSWLRLHVFAPGTLSTSSLGTVDPQSALQSFSWGLTPDTTWDIDLKTGKFLTINTVADGSSVSASFSPGGDFDWYI